MSGQIALTRMPYGAISRAKYRVRAMTANLLALEPAKWALPVLPAHEARLTTEPERCVIMCGKTARLTIKTPSTLTRSIVCSTSSGISSAGPVQAIPALSTSTSILWKRKSPQLAGRWGDLVRPGSQCASSTSSTPKGQCSGKSLSGNPVSSAAPDRASP